MPSYIGHGDVKLRVVDGWLACVDGGVVYIVWDACRMKGGLVGFTASHSSSFSASYLFLFPRKPSPLRHKRPSLS